MKNIINFLAVALVMFTVISCDKNEILPDNSLGDVITLSATIGADDTKTSLGNDFSVLWSEGDAIAVIQGKNVYEFSLVSGAGTTSGVFACVNHEGFQASQAFQAFYPYDLVSVNEWNETIYNVPSEQPYVANNFASKVAPMAASGTIGKSLVFSNLFSVLKLQVKGTEKVQEIDVVSMVNMKMSGSAVLSFPQDGIPSIEKWESGARSVKLNCGEGVQLKDDEYTDFMIMIPSGDGQGWAVVIKTEQNTYYKSSTKGYDVAPGSVLEMKGFVLGTSDVNINTTTSYVENGVYLGEGVEINGLLWAPVNCGYEKAIGDYKGYTWGKLYQWGASGGIGYSTNYDATGEGINNYHSYSSNAWSNNNNNPCPDGWRVPTSEELGSLLRSSDLKTDGNGKQGYWFGTSVDDRKVFFQAAGEKSNNLGGAGRGQNCYYWSATSLYYQNGSQMYCMYDSNNELVNGISPYQNFKEAASVRCVKDVVVPN